MTVPCSADPEAWYDSARDAATKKVCHACPAREMCLDVAVRLEEPWGVWGGYTADERLRLTAGRTAQTCRQCGIGFVPVVTDIEECNACTTGAPSWPIDDDVPAIRQLAAAGFSDARIAERLHRNKNTVKSCRVRHGIPSGHVRGEKRNRSKQVLAECGTASAYRRHLRRKEPVDDACRHANALDVAEKRARQPKRTVAPEEVNA